MYRIVFTEDARKDLKELKKKAPYAIDKLSKLLEEMQIHPRIGTPVMLKIMYLYIQ